MSEGEMVFYPLTRADAKEFGERFYFTGVPCSKGSVDVRLARNGQCQCGPCSDRQSQATARWLELNKDSIKDRVKEAKRRHYLANREAIVARVSSYSKTDEVRARIRQRHAERMKNDPEYAARRKEVMAAYGRTEKAMASAAKYREDNRTKLREACRLRRQNQPLGSRKRNVLTPEQKGRALERQRERYANDIGFRLLTFMRSHLRRALTLIGTERTAETRKQLGYTPEILKNHIESQFHSGMAWSNYGQLWEIDHIASISELVACGVRDPAVVNALSNLRPVTKTENRRKSASFELGVQIRG